MEAQGARSRPRNARLPHALLLLYFAGILCDFGGHAWYYLHSGDRRVESYEWIVAAEASMFWPLDLVARALLALG